MVDVKGAIKDVLEKTPYGKGDPLLSFKLTYDSQSNQLEPIYYWLLDFMQDAGVNVEKVVDNFTSSPGSGHFSDMGQKKSRMIQEAMNIFGGINQVTKSVINLLYDLKEFEIRLDNYDKAKSDDKDVRESGLLSLKQIWLDNVDIKRGNTAIKAMAFSNAPFATLIDAFMIVNDPSLKGKDGKELDLNERVKRVLQQRIGEFNSWLQTSESELRKRFKIQRAYLKTQVETLKLYTSWAAPYLDAAEKLKQNGFEGDPSLVNAFSTTMFELVLFGKKESKGKPSGMEGYNLERKYYSCQLISFKFRGHVGQQVTQKGDYAFGLGGRVDMNFDSYAFNEQELKFIEKKIRDKAVEDSFKVFQDATTESLDQLKDELDHFLDYDEKEEKKEDKKEKKKQDDIDPFSAIFSGVKQLITWDFKGNKKKKKDPEKPEEIRADNYVEGEVRKIAANGANGFLYALYDVYKKAHGMASSPEDFDTNNQSPGTKVGFKDLFKKNK